VQTLRVPVWLQPMLRWQGHLDIVPCAGVTQAFHPTPLSLRAGILSPFCLKKQAQQNGVEKKHQLGAYVFL
jgi:hypothetical protein